MILGEDRKKIGIIGAGPSGLLAIKYALQYGLQPQAFQKASGIGGVWHPETGSTWHQMPTNISKYTMTFTDFPWPQQSPIHPLSGQVAQYLTNYAQKFNLLQYINFNCEVVCVERVREEKEGKEGKEAKSGYRVVVRKGEEVLERVYGEVVIASGIFHTPYIPQIQGLENFKGSVIHSKYYRHGQPYKDKKVLILGGSLTAVQLSTNISNYASKTYHSFKKPFWIVPRYIGPESKKLPTDFSSTRQFYLKPPSSTAVFDKNLYYSKNLCKEQQEFGEIRVEEGHFGKIINVSISDNYISQFVEKKIIPIRSKIHKINPTSVQLQLILPNPNPDPTLNPNPQLQTYQIDSIILCTGYTSGLTYLSPQIHQILAYKQPDQIQPIIAYHQMYHPQLPGLFFVGMYKGPYFGVMELQTRFVMGVVSGRVGVPGEEEVDRGLGEERGIRDREDRGQFPHPDYVRFADSIAKAAGHNLQIQKFLLNPTSPQSQQFFKMVVFPCVSNCFTTTNLSQQISQSKQIVQKISQKCQPITSNST